MFEGREWTGQAGACFEKLERLRAAMPVPLPDSFYALLAFNNGGWGPLACQPYAFILMPVEEILEIFLEDHTTMEHFPGLVFFGRSGGGDYLAFDTRRGPPFEIVATELYVEMGEWISVAPDFDSFLELVGYEAPEILEPYPSDASPNQE